MEHISFANISPVQFFDSTQYKDINVIELIPDPKEEKIITVAVVHDYEDEDGDIIETIKDHQYERENTIMVETMGDSKLELRMELFDDRDENILVASPSLIKFASKTLDISPNIPETPIGINDGVIGKIPVILAQLLIPINISSFIDLPEDAIKVNDINKKLHLSECILMQPTNILFIKGFINKNVEYTASSFLNLKGISGKIHSYTVDIPFECSTAVSFFTRPLDPIENTKKVFEYIDDDLSTFNQISEEFFNEIPFCKLLSSKIVEFDEIINQKDSKMDFIQIQEKMSIEIRLEILQNQPIVIPSANNKINEN